MIESKIEDLLGHGRNHFIWTQSNLDLLAHLFGSYKQDMFCIGICLASCSIVEMYGTMCALLQIAINPILDGGGYSRSPWAYIPSKNLYFS